MQLPKLKGDKKTPKQYVDQNPIEALLSVGSGVATAIKKDVTVDSVHTAWEQLLDADYKEKAHDGGDLAPGQEISLGEVKEKAQEITEMGRGFAQEVIHAGKRAISENHQEIEVKIQEILIEIKQLANTSEELQKHVEVVALEQRGEETGVYHINFLEKVLEWVRDARMNVEDSLVWFHALRSKKASKQYGSLAKKHGTSFTLSNERTAATQTG